MLVLIHGRAFGCVETGGPNSCAVPSSVCFVALLDIFSGPQHEHPLSGYSVRYRTSLFQGQGTYDCCQCLGVDYIGPRRTQVVGLQIVSSDTTA